MKKKNVLEDYELKSVAPRPPKMYDERIKDYYFLGFYSGVIVGILLMYMAVVFL